MWEWTLAPATGLLVAVPDDVVSEVIARVDQPPGAFRLDPYRDVWHPASAVGPLRDSLRRAVVTREAELRARTLAALHLADVAPWAMEAIRVSEERDSILTALRELMALCELAVQEGLGVRVYGD